MGRLSRWFQEKQRRKMYQIRNISCIKKAEWYTRMRYQENTRKKEGKHHANQYSAAKTDRTTIPDDPHGLNYK